MGIYGMIRAEIAKRKKFASLSPTQQYKVLEKEKAQLQQKETLRKNIQESKREIKELKKAKLKEKAEALKSGIQRFKQGIQKGKSRLKSNLGSTTGSRNIFGSGSRDVFGGGRNAFYGSEQKPRPPRKRVIVIQQ